MQLLPQADNSKHPLPNRWDKIVKARRRGPTLTFLVIVLEAEARGLRDYARGLLSQQWNTRFPWCCQSGSTASGPTKKANKAKVQDW